jgi:RNA polymerase sigma factor (sigma-70 family)
MERGRTQAAWSSLDTLLTAGTLGSLTDGQLLDHFGASRDATSQEAFRILVERHGAMVLGVCRGLVRDPHEAEDAFQATFLVLVRRSNSIRKRDTIGPWLYGVACRVAGRARIRSARRRKREVAADLDMPSRDSSSGEMSETDPAIHEEISRLPDSLRAPLILCCLEGMSYDLACRRLGMREPTLRGRLHRARKTLESRLRRRGVLAPIAARLFDSGKLSLPPLPSTLIESTTQFAVRWSTLSGLLVGAGAVPESIAGLAQGVIHAMLFQAIKVCGIATILAVGVVGTLVVAQQAKRPLEPGPAYQGPPRKDVRQDSVPPLTKDDVQRNEAELRRAKEASQTAKILEKLDETIDLKLPDEVQLHAFLKAIKQATTDKNFMGIPIYVDPLGLQEVGISLTAHVSVRRNGRLGFVLRETLRPFRLSFIVRDGFLMITSRDNNNDRRLEELDQKVDRLLKAIERMERVIGDHAPGGRNP